MSPNVSVPAGELREVGVVVCKCKRTGCLAATQVPEKGFFAGWLRGLGWGRLLLRSDTERALLAFLRAAAAGLEGVAVVEQASLEGDHAANGLAEVGVREVKAQTRVLKSHLEERLKIQSEPLATWLVRHSSALLCQGTEFKMMGERLSSDAQESVGGVKLLNLEKKQHFYRSPHVVMDAWQAMRRD